jgi:hypothetical protein
MDDNARLQLQKMIKANDVEDMTGLIRELKHSIILKNNINALLNLMSKYKDDEDTLFEEATFECNFLFTYYTDIFNKIRKNEIDLKILFNFLDVLNKIESGELDQHEGSFVVGKLLKEMYIDSALKKADKLNKDKDNEKKQNAMPIEEPKKISFKDFKQLKLTR